MIVSTRASPSAGEKYTIPTKGAIRFLHCSDISTRRWWYLRQTYSKEKRNHTPRGSLCLLSSSIQRENFPRRFVCDVTAPCGSSGGYISENIPLTGRPLMDTPGIFCSLSLFFPRCLSRFLTLSACWQETACHERKRSRKGWEMRLSCADIRNGFHVGGACESAALQDSWVGVSSAANKCLQFHPAARKLEVCRNGVMSYTWLGSCGCKPACAECLRGRNRERPSEKEPGRDPEHVGEVY